jgi:CDP-glycerol glycerophosphotransferase (TagB/SpsB family)
MKQWIKMLLQNVLLPVLYQWYSRKPIQPGSVLFADAHHASMPFSMQKMYEQMQEKERRGECRITLFIRDFGQLSFGEMVRFLLQFMRRYATAEYVFICDYFLPVSSCRKRPETTVVQLWHSCGLMKKIAYDTGEDIPKNYRGDMFGNYSCLTLSAEVCVPIHARALRLPAERIHATGVSRTDYYFDPAWNRARRETFYANYPEAKGKKIALWAPTFRGNAARPRLEGLEAVRQVADTLQEDWMVLIKAHPHVDAHGMVSNCTIPTEELFAVADVLITDYSSVLFDYLLYRKPAVLFAPDLEDYEGGRGFYLDYQTIPYPIARTGAELTDAIRGGQAWMETHREAIDAFRERYVGACDGHATERIMQLTGLSSL